MVVKKLMPVVRGLFNELWKMVPNNSCLMLGFWSDSDVLFLFHQGKNIAKENKCTC